MSGDGSDRWDAWRPDLEATVLFVVRDGEVLLIHKKRGLGAGVLNGAGGKVDPGETPIEAAVREFEEELEARPHAPRKLGEVACDLVDDLSILIHVFRSDGLHGTASETAEATPMWFREDEIPYDRMWPDDQYWFPHLLADRPFEARARMTEQEVFSCEVRRVGGGTGWESVVAGPERTHE